MKVGVHDWRSYDESMRVFPGMTQVREFVPGVRKPETTDLSQKIMRLAQPALDKGLTPWVSFKLDPTDVHQGRWDVQLSDVASEVPESVFLIPWHEPENDMSASEFTGMFDTVASRLKEYGGQQPVVYSAMAYQFRPGSASTNIAPDWFPETADIYAVDVYSGGTWPVDYILPEHPGFKRWNEKRLLVEERDGISRPWAVTERGFITSDNHGARADTIRFEAAWIQDSDCSAYIYWNTQGTEGNPDILLDRRGEEAVAELISDLSEVDESYPGEEYIRGYQDGHAAGFWQGHEVAVNKMRDALNAIDSGE